MIRIITFSLVFIVFLSSFSAAAGKKHCQDYRKKLDNIQAQQRQANSHKRSNTLSTQEAKARDSWWRCETGKLNVKKKKKKKKNSKSKSTINKKHKKLNTQGSTSEPHQNNKTLRPLVSNSSEMLSSKYQGEQLQAWWSFYQAKKNCARPKSIQQFAACAEDKRRQQIEFEKIY